MHPIITPIVYFKRMPDWKNSILRTIPSDAIKIFGEFYSVTLWRDIINFIWNEVVLGVPKPRATPVAMSER